MLVPVGQVPRLVVDRRRCGTLDTPDGPVALTVATTTGAVSVLPDHRDGVVLVVARAVADRDDLVFPDDLVRDGPCRVVGCRALGRVRRR